MKKTLFFLILFILLAFYSNAQDIQSKIHEIGLSFNSLNSFGIRYKCGNQNTLLRLTILTINGNKLNSAPDSIALKNASLDFGLNIGFEKGKSINEKLDFYYGAEFLISYGSDSYEDVKYRYKRDSWTIVPGLGFVLGLNYKITNDIKISVEIVPSVRYSYGKTANTNNGIEVKQTNTGYIFGLSNSGANLTLAYRF